MKDNNKRVVTFKLRAGRDSDIIRWLDGLPEMEKSFHIRAALKEWLGRNMKVMDTPYNSQPTPLGGGLQDGNFDTTGAVDDDALNKKLDLLKW